MSEAPGQPAAESAGEPATSLGDSAADIAASLVSAGEALRGLSLPADSAAGRVARAVSPWPAPTSSSIRGPRPTCRRAPWLWAVRGRAVRTGGRVLGALTVYRKRGREPFSAGTVEMLVAFAAQAGVVLALAEGANARHRVALYEERERIARELHDVIVQRLYGAGMQLDRVRRNMRKRFAQADGARLSDAIDQLDQTIEEIRHRARAGSPEPRHDTGTPTDLAESARGEVRIAASCSVTRRPWSCRGNDRHPRGKRRPHPAALREAMSNVVRHSGASESRVTLARDSDGVKLRVRDNGPASPKASPPWPASSRRTRGRRAAESSS